MHSRQLRTVPLILTLLMGGVVFGVGTRMMYAQNFRSPAGLTRPPRAAMNVRRSGTPTPLNPAAQQFANNGGLSNIGPGNVGGYPRPGMMGPAFGPVPTPQYMVPPAMIMMMQQMQYAYMMQQMQFAQFLNWLVQQQEVQQMIQRILSQQPQQQGNWGPFAPQFQFNINRPNNANRPNPIFPVFNNRPNPGVPGNNNRPNPVNPPVNPPPNPPPAAAAQSRFCCNTTNFASSALPRGAVFDPSLVQCSQMRVTDTSASAGCDGGMYLGDGAAGRCQNACKQVVGWCLGHPTYLMTAAEERDAGIAQNERWGGHRLFTYDDCMAYPASINGDIYSIRVAFLPLSQFRTYQEALQYGENVINLTECGNGVQDAGEECDLGEDNGRGYGCAIDCSYERAVCRLCSTTERRSCIAPCQWRNNRCEQMPVCSQPRRYF